MMQAAEDWLIERGVWKVQLLVRADNAKAKGFYEQLGYRDTQSDLQFRRMMPVADD